MNENDNSRAAGGDEFPIAGAAAEAREAVSEQGRCRVLVTIHSMQDGEAAASAIHKGEFFPKGRSSYIRYEEIDELHGSVRTLIRWSGDEISLSRRGGVESDQTFAAGASREGSYRSGHLAFSTMAETEELSADAGDGGALPLTLSWTYRLRIEDQISGRFQLRLHIQEDTHS